MGISMNINKYINIIYIIGGIMSEQTAKIKEKKKFKVPHTYVIIFTIVLIMAIPVSYTHLHKKERCLALF